MPFWGRWHCFLSILVASIMDLNYPPSKSPFECNATVIKLSLWIDFKNKYPFLSLPDFQQVSIYEPSVANTAKGFAHDF